MPSDHLPETVLACVGLAAILKALWGLLSPGAFRDAALWWTRAVWRIGAVVAIALFLLAAALLVIVLLDQPLVHWMLVLLAALIIGAGIAYLQPRTIERVTDFWIVDRSLPAIRALCAGALLIGLALVGFAAWSWIAR